VATPRRSGSRPAPDVAAQPAREHTRAPHRPSRRQEILDAAIRVFGTEGVTTTTIADIAGACGVVPASVYYHFESKEAVLAAAVEQIGEEILAAERAAGGGDPVGDLAPRVRAVFEWNRANPEKAGLFYLWSVGISAQIEEQRRRFVQGRIDGALRYQRARGPTRQDAVNRELAARTAIELAMATSVAWLSGDVFAPGTTAERLAEDLARQMTMILDG